MPPRHSTTLAAVAAAMLGALGSARTGPAPGDVLIFEEDFNTFNFSLWKHEITLAGDGNWAFELYANNRSNSFVRNGSLHIHPTLSNATFDVANADVNLWGGDPATTCTDNGFFGCERTGGAGGNIVNPVTSARVRTAETFAFRYGRVEVVAKLPRGDWLWPAIWAVPVSSAYGQWPASGEIDIVESRGNARGYPGGGVETFSSTLHWGPFWPEDGYLSTHASYTLPSGDLSDDFHTYGFIWNATNMITYIDDDVAGIVLNVAMNTSFWERGGWSGNPTLNNPWQDSGNINAPFDQRFYLVMNVAVGGTNGYFPDGVANKPWTDASPNAMDAYWSGVNQWYPTWQDGGADMVVDSVKIWQTPGTDADFAYRLML